MAGLPASDELKSEIEGVRRNGEGEPRRFGDPHRVIAAAFSIGQGGIFTRSFIYARAKRDIVMAACALERYRMANGGYPDELASLAPRFLSVEPVDICRADAASRAADRQTAPAAPPRDLPV